MSRSRFTFVLFVIGFMALLVGIATYQSGLFRDAHRIEQPGLKKLSFALTSASQTIDESIFSDKVTVVFFGFTFCPDICPTGLSRIKSVLKRHEGHPVQALFVSVDPERDTPERLAEYVRYFHKDIIGATAGQDALQSVTRQFGAFFLKEAGTGESYQVAHTASFFVVNQKGELAKVFSHDATEEQMSLFIDQLL